MDWSVEGEALTLDDIEHRILRPVWQDPRMHYVLNCAAIGCPELNSEAFTAENADAIISEFSDPTDDGADDDYFLSVTGGAADYRLLVNRGSVFDIEPNDSPTDRLRDLTDTGLALGALDATAAAPVPGELGGDSFTFASLGDYNLAFPQLMACPLCAPVART